MVGKETPMYSVKNDTLVVDTASVSVKHENMLLSPTSSHSSDNESMAGYSGCDQKAMIKCEDNSESTSSNDKLDR
jgi:hypothetical protein